jgi:hypothetical protein
MGFPAALAVAACLCLAGCPTVDLGDTPSDIGSCLPDRAYFESRIWPDYIERTDMPARSCIGMNGCHRNTDGRSSLRLSFQPPIDFDANYRAVTRFLNCGDPSSSDLVQHPRRIRPHPVQVFPTDNEPEIVNVFLPWFDQ